MEFNDSVRSVKLVLEALIHHSGVYRIPDMIITDFKGEFKLLQFLDKFLQENNYFREKEPIE